MNKKTILLLSFVFAAGLIYAVSIYAQGSKLGSVGSGDLKSVKLPEPETQGGMPLMQALKERKSQRSYRSEPLSMQMLSNLLWAANGVNRPESGKTTAPSAKNRQIIDIYVAKADGLYLYNAKENTLEPISDQDVRAVTGRQSFAKEAPVNLVYVANLPKKQSPDKPDLYAYAEVGFISQNVYLFCASENLATVVRGSIDRSALSKAMGLKETQQIILAQTVGHVKD